MDKYISLISSIVGIIAFLFVPIAAWFALTAKLAAIDKRVELIELEKVPNLQILVADHIKNSTATNKKMIESIDNLSTQLRLFALEFEIRVKEVQTAKQT